MSTEDQNTEQKIKEAARELFHQKGFEGTKTRDIAEAAGINVALMNYYFRSKKKLFDLIMFETVETFLHSILDIIREEDGSMDQIMRKLVAHYIQMLQKEPELPIFILSEIRKNPATITDMVNQRLEFRKTPFFQFLTSTMKADTHNPANPGQILLSAISMTVFPFAAKPLIRELFGLDEDEFQQLMEDRKKLIPLWTQNLMGADWSKKSEDHET